MRVYALVTGTVLLAACGGAAGPPAPPTLSYQVPADPSAVYLLADTAEVQVDAGGQTVDVVVASRATLDMTFEPTPEGDVRVTADFRDLEARATNPMGPPQEVDEGAVHGELVFTLSPRGHGSVVSLPEVDMEARSFVSPSVLAATFFPRLPGRAVVAGDTWTDTVVVDTDEGDVSIDATSVVTYTAVGDTAVMGRRYLRVDLTSQDERFVEGAQMGMDMTQELTGTSEGWFLWDPVRRLPVEVVVRAAGEGTMEVSAAPFPLALRADNTSVIRLLEPEDPGM